MTTAVLGVALGLVALAALASAYRMLTGPTDADRVIAADLLLFAVIGILALIGSLNGSAWTFDLILVATLLGFLGALSLARALTRGER